MSAINPFQIPAALAERFVGRRLRASAEPPPWMGAALLASFAWFFLAYHTPGSPRALAVYLPAYAVVFVVAALMWGRGWLARGAGFAGLTAAGAPHSDRTSA